MISFEELTKVEHYQAKKDYNGFLSTMNSRLLTRFEEHLNQILPNNLWDRLNQQNGKFVAMHSISVLYVTMKSDLYTKTTPWEQNVLKWAALLHDIRKRSIPEI